MLTLSLLVTLVFPQSTIPTNLILFYCLKLYLNVSITKKKSGNFNIFIYREPLFLFRISAFFIDINGFVFGDNVKNISNITVSKDMKVCEFLQNFEISYNDLNWILPENSKLTRWSQLENLLARNSFITLLLLSTTLLARHIIILTIKSSDEN